MVLCVLQGVDEAQKCSNQEMTCHRQLLTSMSLPVFVVLCMCYLYDIKLLFLPFKKKRNKCMNKGLFGNILERFSGQI